MPKENFRNKVHLRQTMRTMMLYWTLVVVIMLQQFKAAGAKQFKGDNCKSKNEPGICREWDDCPIMKTLIDNGEYTIRDVISCGFGTREELICCPVKRNQITDDTTNVANKNNSPDTITTTQVPVRDFWLDLLETTTTTTTTPVPDFWLDLLKPTTPAASTTTTTFKPLIIGDQKLNSSSEFFDFNALLVAKQNGGQFTQEQQTQTVSNRPNISPSNQGFIRENNNRRGNLNRGPVNINQWNFDQTGNGFNGGTGFTDSNNARGHLLRRNGNGNSGWNWGSQNSEQQNFNKFPNMGRGRHNNNGRGGNHHNNGRFRNIFGAHDNQNQHFFPSNNNLSPNIFPNDDDDTHNRSPGRPVNHIEEQNPSISFAFNPTENNNEEKRIHNLLKDVFVTSTTSNINTETATAHDVTQENYATQRENIQPMVWLTTGQDNHNQLELVNHEQVPAQFQVVPIVEQQINGNDLEVMTPSANFVQQPVVIETWSSHSEQTTGFNPVQTVYENLVNSGMNVVKAHENQIEPLFYQEQQLQSIQPADQVVVLQSPQTSTHQFVQQPEFIPQPQPLQMHSLNKEPRSTSKLPQFGSSILNVQSPPTGILDSFKPFEFRPPPAEETSFSEDTNSLSTKPATPSKERPAVRACHRIDNGLNGTLSHHILDGTPVRLGEFPHMAAIGYRRIGDDDSSTYDIRCGGTLIDTRFVLTAAHCIAGRDNVPAIVRLGVVNFTDPVQMRAAVELKIKQIYIHEDYLASSIYNDIALLELENDAPLSENIYPVCLYTDERDPDAKIKLWVSGWGTINTTTRSFSDILLKAPLYTTPLENCNTSYASYIGHRRIRNGIIQTQLCAEDKDQVKDACRGDSGGPLMMILDETLKQYRLVGVISSGIDCASTMPGLYTRVAAYLDFIERIVWPNGGD